jgi:hypothetical protein
VLELHPDPSVGLEIHMSESYPRVCAYTYPLWRENGWIKLTEPRRTVANLDLVMQVAKLIDNREYELNIEHVPGQLNDPECKTKVSALRQAGC